MHHREIKDQNSITYIEMKLTGDLSQRIHHILGFVEPNFVRIYERPIARLQPLYYCRGLHCMRSVIEFQITKNESVKISKLLKN